ncbi:MAG: helix-hairpin-helix domain-containing protein [Gallionella sp.]
MKPLFLRVAITSAMMLLSTGLVAATESKSDSPQRVTITTDGSATVTPVGVDGKHKHHAKSKLVDINNANKQELMKLPGISDSLADKIIAGRPYGSKAWLVSSKIIPMETYQTVNELIICKVSKKDYDRIMAQAKSKKN